MGAHLVEIESEEESSWLATEFLMTGLLTLYTNYTKMSNIIKISLTLITFLRF